MPHFQIRNWKKFQHFKDRRPPWIKLYRDLLDSHDWHNLDGESSKTLIMLWLLASETDDGSLPQLPTLAFRLRTTETRIKSILTKLSPWLGQADINLISERNQLGPSETETETETETERATNLPELSQSLNTQDESTFSFDDFWSYYPKKVDKQEAADLWKKLKPDDALQAEISEGLHRSMKTAQWKEENGKFIPSPARWLRRRKWQDEGVR